jgi:hypothetical protein
MSIIISYIIPAQFKPVPVLAKDPVAACKIPARVSGSGMVSSVNKEHHSFILFPTQNVSASTHHETIPVQAVLEKGPKWPNLIARLLSLHGFLHGFVSFTGKLAHFEDNSANIRSNLHSCAVIAVDSVTDAYIFLFFCVEVLIIIYDKMVSHMRPTCALYFVIKKACDPEKDLPYLIVRHVYVMIG